MQPIRALKQLKRITTEYFSTAHMAKQNNQSVVYLNVFTPVELFYAMDMFPVYPENHAAIVGARKMSQDVAPAAENMGYSMDLCSYPRCDLGFHQDAAQPDLGFAEAGSSRWFQQPVRDHYQMVRGAQPHVRRAHGSDRRAAFGQRGA